jgi:hypothetical protein
VRVNIQGILRQIRRDGATYLLSQLV